MIKKIGSINPRLRWILIVVLAIVVLLLLLRRARAASPGTSGGALTEEIAVAPHLSVFPTASIRTQNS